MGCLSRINSLDCFIKSIKRNTAPSSTGALNERHEWAFDKFLHYISNTDFSGFITFFCRRSPPSDTTFSFDDSSPLLIPKSDFVPRPIGPSAQSICRMTAQVNNYKPPDTLYRFIKQRRSYWLVIGSLDCVVLFVNRENFQFVLRTYTPNR